MADEQLTLEQLLDARTVDVTIDDYGYTGEGYVRLADGWLSIPGAMPAERVSVQVDPDQKGRRVYGQVVDVLEASPMRRDPLCELDSVCRGCQLRHVMVSEELQYKVRTIREIIEKFAGVPPDAQPDIEVITPQPIARGDAFRIRTEMTYRRLDGEAQLGLVSPVRDELVPMHTCPALIRPVRRVVGYLVEVFEELEALPPDRRRDEEGAGPSAVFRPDPGIRTISVASPVHGRGLIDIKLGDVEDEARFLEAVESGPLFELGSALAERLPEGVGLAVSGAEYRQVFKEPTRLRLPVCGLQLEVGFDDWFPATIEPTEEVYERMLELLVLDGDEEFLDIGCGIGTIALLAARQVRHAVGVDVNRRSVANAEINAVGNGFENVEFIVGGWENALRRLTLDGRSFEKATINPMREPLGHRPLSYLRRLGIERLVYLGPSPASAAKDIGVLCEQGWQLDYLGAANIHPATYHTMLVARLRAPDDG